MYFLRTFFSGLTMPLSLFWILLLAGFSLLYFKKKKWGTACIVFSLVWIFVISTPFVPVALIKSLEKDFPALLNPQQKVDDSSQINIIVLGGGHTFDVTKPPNNQLSLQALGRLTEGIRIQRLIKGSKLILSGWGGPDGEPSQASVLKNTALLLGVADSVIEIQESPRNTQEEAETYVKNHGKNITLIIVTSAVHMPRAIKLFKEVGLDPIAAPTNHLYKKGPNDSFDWIPSAGNIALMEIAMHEYMGMLVSYFE